MRGVLPDASTPRSESTAAREQSCRSARRSLFSTNSLGHCREPHRLRQPVEQLEERMDDAVGGPDVPACRRHPGNRSSRSRSSSPRRVPATMSRSASPTYTQSEGSTFSASAAGEQRLRVRLRVGRGISADDRDRARRKRQPLEDRQREPCCLVGDDAPAQTPTLDLRQNLFRVLEQLRFFAKRCRVVVEEAVAKELEVGARGRCRTPRRACRAHHATRADEAPRAASAAANDRREHD